MTKETNLYGVPYESETQWEEAIALHHQKVHDLLQENWQRKFKVQITGLVEKMLPPIWSDVSEITATDAVDFADYIFEECEGLPIKDGVDFIRENGCIGILAYYSGRETKMMIIPA